MTAYLTIPQFEANGPALTGDDARWHSVPDGGTANSWTWLCPVRASCTR